MTQPSPRHAVVGTESASLGDDRYKVQTWVPKVQIQVELLKNLIGPLFPGAINFFPGQLPHFLVIFIIVINVINAIQ